MSLLPKTGAESCFQTGRPRPISTCQRGAAPCLSQQAIRVQNPDLARPLLFYNSGPAQGGHLAANRLLGQPQIIGQHSARQRQLERETGRGRVVWRAGLALAQPVNQRCQPFVC